MIQTRGFGGPFRYLQGPGALKALPQLARPYGRKLLIVIDAFLYHDLKSLLESYLQGSELTSIFHQFGGECTLNEIDRLSQLGQANRSEVICGLGGGKTLDTAKLTAQALKKPLIIMPSSASTDAPVSAMGVIYQPDGRHLRCQLLEHAPELILVDSSLIAQAPIRLFVAGLGDALSTHFEAQANALSHTPNYLGPGYQATLAGAALAKTCHQVILKKGLKALKALQKQKTSPDFEDVLEANILLSGLGFENNGCAAAHALHTGIHEIEGSQRLYHGEVVAFGLLFQLILEKTVPKKLAPIVSFMAKVGLPLCFSDLGLPASPKNLTLISTRLLDGNSGIEAEPFPVTKPLIKAALKEADHFGQAYRQTNPHLPPALCKP
ncbi:MAG: glycerol dehydrogenase [Deltaproteobacteria bacterium]|jgi:glycerol dehydrogenase|nr:glycerol dehydrogenase [Deltaproteobacteria bacterium]